MTRHYAAASGSPTYETWTTEPLAGAATVADLNAFEIYRTMRDGLGTAAATLLTPQAAANGGPSWDVLPMASAGGRTIVLSAIQWDEAEDELTIRPQGLRRRGTYSVRSVDTGELGTATGAELMADGITVVRSPNAAAHILILRRQ